MSDFEYTPDYVVDETVQYKTLISSFENGSEQRRRKWANPVRRWLLTFKTRNLTELNAMRDFFIGRYGSFGQFTWTNPNDAVEYMVRFADDAFRFSLKAYQLYDFEVSFIEVK